MERSGEEALFEHIRIAEAFLWSCCVLVLLE